MLESSWPEHYWAFPQVICINLFGSAHDQGRAQYRQSDRWYCCRLRPFEQPRAEWLEGASHLIKGTLDQVGVIMSILTVQSLCETLLCSSMKGMTL